MNIEKKEEYDCSVSDEKCFPHTFKNKKRTDPYLKDGKCIIHRLPKLNLKDCDDDEQKRQRVQIFFEGMGW